MHLVEGLKLALVRIGGDHSRSRVKLYNLGAKI